MTEISGDGQIDSETLHITLSAGDNKRLVCKVVEAAIMEESFKRIVVDGF